MEREKDESLALFFVIRQIELDLEEEWKKIFGMSLGQVFRWIFK